MHASEEVSVLVCYDKDDGKIKTDWDKRLRGFNFSFRLKYQPIDNKIFRICRSCYGSYAPYLLLSSPHYANTDKMLYIDADTVFTDDICKLYHIDMADSVIGLFTKVQCNERGEIEKKLLYNYNKNLHSYYYGSCLALINTKKYKELKKLELCQDIARRYPFELMLWDQTVLNCAFRDEEICDLSHLGLQWVQEASRNGNRGQFKSGMIHFCGAPKPWDLLGEFYHPYYTEWHNAATSAGILLPMIRNYLSISSWKRAFRVKNQYKIWFN